MPFTSTTLLASSAELLEASGYKPVPIDVASPLRALDARLFEDPFCVAAVVAFNTCQELLERWPDAQSALIDAVSVRLSRSEPKAWDAYLVLLTPALVSEDVRPDVTAIRYDTTRLRKLVATGDELQTLEDVRRAIMPLLPVSPASLAGTRAVLDQLIDVLAARGVDRERVTAMVSAFASNRPVMATLYKDSDAP